MIVQLLLAFRRAQRISYTPVNIIYQLFEASNYAISDNLINTRLASGSLAGAHWNSSLHTANLHTLITKV